MKSTGLYDEEGEEIFENDQFNINGKIYTIKWIGAGFWLTNSEEKDIEPTMNLIKDLIKI